MLFCDYANQTAGNKTNLAGIFDRVYVHPEAKVTPPFMIFIRTAETLKSPVRVTLLDPSSEVVSTLNYDATGHEATPDMPFYIQFLAQMQFPVTTAGVYWFDVSYGDESLGGTPLMVEFRETEDKESGTDSYP